MMLHHISTSSEGSAWSIKVKSAIYGMRLLMYGLSHLTFLPKHLVTLAINYNLHNKSAIIIEKFANLEQLILAIVPLEQNQLLVVFDYDYHYTL